MSLFSDLELIKDVDRADPLWICGLCTYYKSLMSPQTAAVTAGVIMFASLFDSHSAVELTAFVHLFNYLNKASQAYAATPQ